MNLKYKPGRRALKTAIAVFLCLVIAFIFKRENAFYAAIAAVVCMMPTYEETFQTGINRAIGTIIGGICGYGVLELGRFIPYFHDYSNMLIVPITLFGVIYICNIFKKQASVSICCIVFLSICANSSRDIDNALLYVINRVIDTSIGIIVAVLVNRFILPKSSSKVESQELINDENE